jgi:adenylate cyclase
MPTDGAGNAKVERRLAAILAADIAGYSALMGADDEATVRDLKAHQSVILPMLKEHAGRVIDTAGDGILAEFASVLNAVKCAVAIQKTMADRNAAIDHARRMQFRIGINQGDVVFDEARVYGDGINIAARLEGIAEPGGICMSGKVYEEIQGRIDLTCEDLGPQQLKNIERPVKAYRVVARTGAEASPTPQKPPLALPDKPSIAVLPFTNMSGDPEQEYIADGIVEDITTELSRFRELFVIARNSSFHYKGQAVDVRQVGRELGVRYVLEGSIRRDRERMRISVQLVEAMTGTHRWAERYDRDVKDVFVVQDEIARTVAAILAAHVSKAEAERTLLKPPTSLQAYDYYMRAAAAYAIFHRAMQVSLIHDTRRLLEQCLAMEPGYARAYALYSETKISTHALRLDGDHLNAAALEDAHQWAEKAVQLDPNLPQAHAQLGYVLCFKGMAEEAVAHVEQAMELNQNFTDRRLSMVLVYTGRAEQAIEVAKAQLRNDPFALPIARGHLGLAYLFLKRYSEAVAPLREFVSQSPNHRPGRAWLAAAYAHLGQLEDARAQAAQIRRLDPHFIAARTFRRATTFWRPEDAEHIADGLRKAGLPVA